MRAIRRDLGLLVFLTILVLPILLPLCLLLMALLGLSRFIPLVLGYGAPAAIIVLPFELAVFGPHLLDRKYRRLFSDEHVIELAQHLARAKTASLALLERPYEGDMKYREDAAREQGNAFETSMHLAVYYTIDRNAADYRHQVSMSYTRGPLARAGVEHLSGIIGQLLSVDILKAQIFQSQGTVGHLIWLMNEDDEQRFAERTLMIPSLSAVKAIRSKARETVGKMRETRRSRSSAERDPKPT